ncbi:MAG: 50S ribosomal protein L3 [Candidatus Asgardarchaeia archaeon]
MGHRKFHAPKHGSLAYLPRKRASRHIGRIRNWPSVNELSLLGFAGYKAGMTHVVLVDNTPHSPYYGHERIRAVTVLDVPPLNVIGIRLYKNTTSGLQVLGEVWHYELPKDLNRAVTIPKNYDETLFEDKINALESMLEKVADVRLILATQPRLTSLPKKKPDIFEIALGGSDVKSKFDYAKSILNEKNISVDKVFSEGEYVDVVAITKGHGFQGPVKRWGIRILQHKSRKTKRGVGAIGPWHPHRVMYTVPRAGQMGLFQRTEYHKILLKIGSVGEEITPAGGFPHYGVVRGNYVLLLGSIPGSVGNLIKIRKSIRPPRYTLESAPQLLYISTTSKM